MKSIEELGEELCVYCPLSDEERSGSPHNPTGCEGTKCEEAYENYLDLNGYYGG